MAAKLMHAVQYDSYGGGAAGLKHVEVPIPAPKKNEVLLKLEAASLNPVDWKIQKGELRPLFPRKFLKYLNTKYNLSFVLDSYMERISGVVWVDGFVGFCNKIMLKVTDVAGEVVEVGQGAKKFKVGDKVVVLLSHFSGGGLAEFAVSNQRLMVARPPEVSAAQGACLPVAGLTAHQALTQCAGIKLDGTGQNKNILITAASGGVGHYAVQLAKLGNTHVTATCGARNVELVKSLGADEVLDYKTEDGAALKSPSGRKYDFIINCAKGIPWSTFEPSLSAKGKVIDIAPTTSSFATFVVKKLTFSKKQLVPLLMIPKGANLECLVSLVKEKKLKAVIDSTHSLSKAEDAWVKSIEGHATGKIILEL